MSKHTCNQTANPATYRAYFFIGELFFNTVPTKFVTTHEAGWVLHLLHTYHTIIHIIITIRVSLSPFTFFDWTITQLIFILKRSYYILTKWQNCTLVQTESICRWQINIKLKKLKTLWKKEKMLATKQLLPRGSLQLELCVNPFPHNDTFWRPWETSLLKTLWEKEKLLVTSNFSFSHSVFYPFG